MKKVVLIIAGVFILFPIILQAQERDNVIETINQLFNGMRASDSTMVADAFTSNARMQTVTENDLGEGELKSGNLQDFLLAVTAPKEDKWDEQVLSYEVSIDGVMATAWTPYLFYLGDEFSHCGVNAFQLVKKSDGWKIFAITDTRRTVNCDISG